MRRFLSVLTLSSALIFSVVAHADTVTFSGTSTGAILPGNDTLTLDPGTFTVVSGIVTQTGSFIVNQNDQSVNGVHAFSFQETVTYNSISHLLTFTGQDDIENDADRLSIFALGPVAFGSSTLNFSSVYIFGDALGAFPVALSASVPLRDVSSVPEPSTLAMCGTGILALAGAARRKLRLA